MWNQKAVQVIPVAISSTGVSITKSNKTYLTPEYLYKTAKTCNY